ncbi:MAG: FapA family protein [Thermodesulfobacteriota bacterium]
MTDEPGQMPLPACEPISDDPDADAVVRLGASSDRMKLGVACYTPSRGSGRRIDAEMVRLAARQAGVAAPLIPEAVEQAVLLLLDGQDARGVVLARGIRPAAARDAALEPLLELSRPVFPGMAFARLHPARQPASGKDLAGNEVPSPDPRAPRALAAPPNAGCVLGEDGVLTATAWGLVTVEGDAVRVAPAAVPAKDRLSVRGTLHGYDAAGAEITVGRVMAELKGMGVAHGIDEAMILATLEVCWDTRQPAQGVVMAQGRPPVNGADAGLELLVAERDAVGATDAQDRVDYRNRGYNPVAEAGQDVARLHPATPGKPGEDVFGQEIPAKPGKPLAVKAGKNVEALEDGLLFRAQIAGVVLAGRGLVEVSDLLVVPGDVDLSSGNVRVQKGSVEVRGSVRSGSVAEAPDSVLVAGAVEDAVVLAGADVTVRGGILMSGEGENMIKAGGTVRAAFAQNARIVAGADVIVGRYLARSDVQAGFRVRAGGWVRITDAKGRIMGGTIIAGQGIETYEAGTSIGVETVLVLTQESDEARALIAEKRELKRQVEHIARIFTSLTPEKAAQLPPDQLAKVKGMLARREKAVARSREIGQLLAAMAQEALSLMESVRIIVRGVAHPGVTIKMGGTSLHLSEPVHFSQFLWDRENKAIKVAPL